MIRLLKAIFRIIRRIFSLKSCYYINSNNILPPPLDEVSEMEYLIKARDGDMEARNTLIVHNLRLVVYIAKKFESTKINIEDLISIGSMGLIKGVQTFKLEKNIKLATYASRCIENEILMYLRKTNKMRQEISLDEVLNVDSEGNEMILADILSANEEETLSLMTKDEDKREIYQALNNLPKREREIIIMRFGLYERTPLTQKEVADLLGISQSYISRLEKRIIDKMRHEIESKAIV
ncbi:MAG: RNA polymerase sporulation sigma factor SigK [Bacilli bacterium]|nr:RNA polymerase sporulation sigma factor SigK [Bacilli bacterium]